MKKTYFIIITILFSSLAFSQCNEIEKLEFGGYYGDNSYNNSEHAFKYFSFDADTTQYCCDIVRIQKYADFIINISKNHIVNRAGTNFYNNLIFQDIMVIYHDYKKLDNYYNIFYDLDKCGKITYWLTYEYQHTDYIKYGFGLEFDKEGELVSSEKFPFINENQNEFKLINLCDAVDVVKKDKRFKKIEIKSIELAYIDNANSFCWLIKEDNDSQLNKKKIELEKWYNYSVNWIYVNSTNKNIERVKEVKGRIIHCGGTLKKPAKKTNKY